MTALVRCVAVTGNPRPESRTKRVVDAVAGQLSRDVPGLDSSTSLDLAALPDSALDSVREAMRTAQVVVVGSPTYKGTYTALLKQLFDGLDAGDLRGVMGIPVMVAGSPFHAHGSNSYLRPLLEEVGALVPLPGRCWLESDLEGLDASVCAWGRATARIYRRLLAPHGLFPE